MQIEQLEIFTEVVRLGSFAAVAEKRQLNATSISRSIQALETELGVKLLQRSTRKLDLTEAGETYYQQILPILDHLDQAKYKALDIKQELKGTLRVTLPLGFAEAQVVPLIPEFRRDHPELKLELLITDECLDLVQEKIDMGVRIGKVSEENWVARPLKTLRFVACASPLFLQKHPFPEPGALEQLPCLNFIAKAEAKQWRFHHRRSGKTETIWINQVLLATHEQAAKSLCLAGEGIALLPDWLVQEELQNKRLLEVFPEHDVLYLQAGNQIWCTYPNREYVPAKTRAFLDFLQERLGNKKAGKTPA
ncbi:LysR family transcriptional regulator [Thiomicrorhabdus xiamenensis]|uniref:LysR family transcriptional regulator n=1 Tax=Thiomicrorhabdus xiamenensis TaxID=2739063 RepID=A0A7D4P3S5_9GAMM|nr:LysR family transcriptional regulator [Thiomicrorhabdus xiamenensis]QKI88796.1 LysR family transcriptional regulator [Thiomicrorhabdus xiamenensis]